MRNRDARIAGILYLVAIVIGLFSLEYLPGRLIVPDDAPATAHLIAANQFLFRLLTFSDVVMGLAWLAVVLALYRLLKDVDGTWASLMVILGGYIQVPMYLFNVVNYAAAFMLVTGTTFLSSLPVAQRDDLAMLFLRIYHYELLASFSLAGLWLLPFGVLVYKSGFLPKTIGVWLVLECFGWLGVCFTGFVTPQYSDIVTNISQPLNFAEILIALWLTIFGARIFGQPAHALMP